MNKNSNTKNNKIILALGYEYKIYELINKNILKLFYQEAILEYLEILSLEIKEKVNFKNNDLKNTKQYILISNDLIGKYDFNDFVFKIIDKIKELEKKLNVNNIKIFLILNMDKIKYEWYLKKFKNIKNIKIFSKKNLKLNFLLVNLINNIEIKQKFIDFKEEQLKEIIFIENNNKLVKSKDFKIKKIKRK